ANTEGGAQSSAMIYSLIETAKENGLDPYRYFVYVLTEAPRLAAEGSCQPGGFRQHINEIAVGIKTILVRIFFILTAKIVNSGIFPPHRTKLYRRWENF